MSALLKKVLQLVRLLIAPVALLALGAYWLVLAIVFVPVVLVDMLFGINRRRFAGEPDLMKGSSSSSGERFDRRNDVSKLVGCNTRNVRYRWTLFVRWLSRLEENREGIRALDFGAGSLRDTFEMASRGYRVTAIDLDAQALRRHAASYDWPVPGGEPELLAGSLDQLAGRQFDVITAFDAIEHSECPESVIAALKSLLAPGGLLLVTVPNARTFYELHARVELGIKRRMGVSWIPGVPHLQFRTPHRWQTTFEAQGFVTREHEMAIGFLVNDAFQTAFKIPLQWIVSPVIDRVMHMFGATLDREAFGGLFFPRWLVEPVALVDGLIAPVTRGLHAWNLFVFQQPDPSNAMREEWQDRGDLFEKRQVQGITQ